MVSDTNPEGEIQIWQCTDQNCHFRYSLLIPSRKKPLPVEKPKKLFTSYQPDRCPRCGGSSNMVASRMIYAEVNKKTEPVYGHQTVHPVEILLDNIRSAFNVGAIFRTSDGAGVAHIHLCGTTPTPEFTKITKTALGAETHVPWTYHTNSLSAVQQIQQTHQGKLQIWALEADPSSDNLFETILKPLGEKRILLLVGNEVTGLDPGLIALCDKVVSIPMLGHKKSLNVAIASGIAIYSICITAPILSKFPR